MTHPSRAAGLARLAAFTPAMGAAYARGRNTDPGPGKGAVSGLSPWLRHRLVTEPEVLATALTHHGPEAARGFVEQLLWRSYWKGWLELRPAEWPAYRRRRDHALATLDAEPSLAEAYRRALEGQTGIACFDAWVAELAETGTLHNHARMWFASIWIFTLGLPWALGADLFLRQLLDADAASNTLSWRWVAGSQTPGKPYVARAENIARHSAGRFNPAGQLDEAPTAIIEPHAQAPAPLPPADAPPAGPVALLLHEDDLHAESLPLGAARVVAVAALASAAARSPLPLAPAARHFTEAALADGLARAGAHFGAPTQALAVEGLADWAAGLGVSDVVMPWAPVGWSADALAPLGPALAARGIRLHRVRRAWDQRCWPLAERGYFPFRERAWPLLRDLAR